MMTSLEDLPLEIVEYIVNTISAQDLSNCCAVSRPWRTIFSNDMFWKKHCNKKLGVYTEKSDCQVEPYFRPPEQDNFELEPVSGYRLTFLRENHLWNNWRSRRFKKEIVEFDCDDSFTHNIHVNFFTNDIVLLHRTFETEVWDVSRNPLLMMSIEFYLKELWENNLYAILGNRLVVVQCNVVQLFDICLESRSWAYVSSFFFDKSEDFSASLTVNADIDEIFQNCTFSDTHVGRNVCGNFFIGVVDTGNSTNRFKMHIWNLKSVNKLKEQFCPFSSGGNSHEVNLTYSETSPNYILFTVESYGSQTKICALLYDLVNFEFLNFTKTYHFGNALLLNQYLCIFLNQESTLQIFKYDVDAYQEQDIEPNELKFNPDHHNVIMKNFNKKLIVANQKEICLINPSLVKLDLLFKLDFIPSDFHVICDKFLVFCHINDYIKEIWEMRELPRKVVSFREDVDSYLTANEIGTKVALQDANKLIILNFW